MVCCEHLPRDRALHAIVAMYTIKGLSYDMEIFSVIIYLRTRHQPDLWFMGNLTFCLTLRRPTRVKGVEDYSASVVDDLVFIHVNSGFRGMLQIRFMQARFSTSAFVS